MYTFNSTKFITLCNFVANEIDGEGFLMLDKAHFQEMVPQFSQQAKLLRKHSMISGNLGVLLTTFSTNIIINVYVQAKHNEGPTSASITFIPATNML